MIFALFLGPLLEGKKKAVALVVRLSAAHVLKSLSEATEKLAEQSPPPSPDTRGATHFQGACLRISASVELAFDLGILNRRIFYF